MFRYKMPQWMSNKLSAEKQEDIIRCYDAFNASDKNYT
ncbi:hypothetical protein BTN50_0289 [Candidatus Enterovibrio altilux]|uniref:Uncharacterized protein n=1 Tax=Candidatus Enterovibrio altilux TaxID=1927128 RepID=A0A291B773_9GAMM|nr:hypothetical protein BTN50_0289 [Candidatus Enterovibrio luxaltus]